MTITLPATGERYFSLALMDAYTNNFAILGSRTTGRDGGTFRIVGPAEAGTSPNQVRSPTPQASTAVRTMATGAAA